MKSLYSGQGVLVGVLVMIGCAGEPIPSGETLSPAPALLAHVTEDVWSRWLEKDVWLQLKYGVEITDLPEFSLAETEAEAAFSQSILARLESIDETSLSDDDRITLAVLRWNARDTIELARFHWLNVPITPYNSTLPIIHQIFTDFQFEKPEDTQRYLRLLSRYPDVIEGFVFHLRQQVGRGIVVPEPEFELTLPFLHGFIQDPTASLFAVSAERLKTIEADTAQAFRAQVDEAIAAQINPALRRLYEYVATSYRDQAPERVGLWQYPQGREYYRYLVKTYTTLDVSPEEVHQIGLDAVARINAKMARAREELGFTASKAEFHHFLKTDPRFYPETPEEVRLKLLSYAEGINAQIDAMFLKRPKAPYDVERLDPALEGAWTYGYYQDPTAANATGIYFFNGSNLHERSMLDAESLTYHELIPGHHFQGGLQEENGTLSALRKNYFSTAFIEGWAEYAASLGLELGRYQDPYDRYGRYSAEMFFAVRLVVDTGMNQYGWTLSRAIAFMRNNLLSSDTEIATESLRYCCDYPGQALSYAMGAHEIRRLREKAASALGTGFDVRRFHQVVLDSGALPLDVLAEIIDHFIEQERANRTQTTRGEQEEGAKR